MNGRSVFVVGGGPSLSGFDFQSLHGKNTIAVNSSIFFVPNPDYFITMDFTWFGKNGIQYDSSTEGKQKIYRSTKAKKFFVVAYDKGRFVHTPNGVLDTRFDLNYDLRVVDEVIYSSSYGGVGSSLQDFHCGSDSGYSGIQLAVALGYSKIYLLGMDFDITSSTNRTSAPTIIPPSEVTLLRSSRSKKIQVSKISVRKSSHFFKKMSSSELKNFKKKLDEYLTPYPSLFKEISEKTSSQIFSCSPNSRLNQYIDYVPLGKAIKND